MAIALNSQKDNSPFWAVIILITIMLMIAVLTNCCKSSGSKLSAHTYVINTSIWCDTVVGTTVKYDPVFRTIMIKNADTLITIYRLGTNDSYRIYEIK